MDKRLLIYRVIIIVILLLLIFRAGHLQLIRGNYYYQLSEGNRISMHPINAPRGKILDASGENVLVSNKISYNVYLLQNEIPQDLSVAIILKKLSSLTNLKLDQLEESYKNSQTDSFRSTAILLKRNIDTETMVIIEENKENLSGILVKESSIRDYVYGQLACHILGYIGEINAKELKDMNSQNREYSVRDIIGKAGLEKEYEPYLKGVDGIEQIEVNSLGQKVRTLGTKPPEPGNNLILNINEDFQEKTERLLNEQFEILREEADKDPDISGPTGAGVIVMNPRNGAILAMTSIPGYDLNSFARGFTTDSYQQLINNPLNPMLDRPIMAAVPPGSIFKLVTGTAAIEYLGVNADTNFVDQNGKFYIPHWSRPFRNWHSGGEGKLDFTRAIARSNNVIFYQLGYDLYKKYGGEKLTDVGKEYGLGSKTGIDLPGEKAGLVPDENWKKLNFNEGWYPGDSVNLAIGQGGLLTTPIQLIEMVCAIANNGIMYRPQIVDKIVSASGKDVVDFKPEVRKYLPFSQKVYKILRQGMLEVTTSSYGTARSVFRDFPVKVAGKTGTAQTSGVSANHGWFVGFAPADNPQIVVLVFLENGNSSVNTLPIAAGIFKEYFGLSKESLKEAATGDVIRQKYYRTTYNLFNFFEKVFSDK